MKILVIESDSSLRGLLKVLLEGCGHEVMAYDNPSACPLYPNLMNEMCNCPREAPCADVIILNDRMKPLNAIDFFKLQRKRGCKAMDSNKAVLSASVTKAVEEAITNLGCHHIKKPFRLNEIREWIDQCDERVAQAKLSLTT
jgi:CheY-like chemotaxis protein